MICCAKPETKDLSQGIGEHRHGYCRACGAHAWQGKSYTRQEWDEFVNGEAAAVQRIERHVSQGRLF